MISVLAVLGAQRRIVAIIVDRTLQQAGHGDGLLCADSILGHTNLDGILTIGGAIGIRLPQAVGPRTIVERVYRGHVARLLMRIGNQLL